MDQTQVLLCQLCGKGLCSDQGQNEANYQKQVDPPATPYKQILPDYRYDEDERQNKKKRDKSSKQGPKQICISIPIVFEQSDGKKESKRTEENTEKGKEKGKEEDQKKEKESEKEKNNGPSLATKASCLPMGSSNCPPPVKMMLCLPCPPPDAVGQAAGSRAQGAQGGQACKPRDYSYRCESRELRGGNLYSCCQCVKRNGLQHDCPRTPCQGRPPCLTKPWPDCWPSGGCHGIDFTREKGTKRYNPCSGQRFDNKVCGPGGAAPKPDCGGQMMVVVCPPPK